MKRFLLIASAAALLMTSCSEEKFLNISGVEEATNGVGNGAIEFQANKPNQSRADFEEFSDNLGIFGIKANDKDDVDDVFTDISEIKHYTEHAQLVFNNYLVGNHKTYSLKDSEGTNETGATPSPTFTSDWYYEGLGTSEYDYPTGFEAGKKSAWKHQYLKYWDASKKYTYFVAYSPYDNTDNSPVLKKGKDDTNDKYIFRLEYPNKIHLDSLNQFMVAARQELNAYHTSPTVTPGNPKYVPLKFNHFQPQIRIAFYEVIRGYKVKMINVQDATATTPAYGVTALPYNTTEADFKGKITVQGNINVDIVKDDTDTDKDLTCEIDYVTPEESDKDFTVLNFNVDQKVRKGGPNGDPTDYLNEERSNKLFSQTIYNVFPTSSANATDLQFVLSFKLIAEDTKEEIIVKNARVVIPKKYTEWNDNSLYTYIFKITKDTNGSTSTPATGSPLLPEDTNPTPALYPIVFDQLTVNSMKDGNSTEYTLYDASHNPTATEGFIFKSGLIGTPAAGKDFAEITFGDENFDLSQYMITTGDPDHKNKDYKTLLAEARAQLALPSTDPSYIDGYVCPFTFSSDNSVIASVDTNTGIVTALNPGETTIHVEYTYKDANDNTITVKDAIRVKVIIKNSFLTDAKQNFHVNGIYSLADLLTSSYVLSNVEWTLFNTTTNKYDIALVTVSNEDYEYNSTNDEITFKKPGKIYRFKAKYDLGATYPDDSRYLTDYLYIEVEGNTVLTVDNHTCTVGTDLELNTLVNSPTYDPTKVTWKIHTLAPANPWVDLTALGFYYGSDYTCPATNTIKFTDEAINKSYTLQATYNNGTDPIKTEYLQLTVKAATPVIP